MVWRSPRRAVCASRAMRARAKRWCSTWPNQTDAECSTTPRLVQTCCRLVLARLHHLGHAVPGTRGDVFAQGALDQRHEDGPQLWIGHVGAERGLVLQQQEARIALADGKRGGLFGGLAQEGDDALAL